LHSQHNETNSNASADILHVVNAYLSKTLIEW